MKKKNLILFLLVLANIQTLASGSLFEYSKNAKYRIPLSLELEPAGIEETAYTDLLRVVDEINRKNNINKKYINSNNSLDEKYDDIDIIPVSQFGSTGDNDFYSNRVDLEGINSMNSKNNFYSLNDIINNPNSIKNSENISDLAYKRVGNSKRFYFGNGNSIKDIIIESKNKFNKDLDQAEKNKNTKYLINGTYTVIEKSDRNPLGITLDEYKTNFFDSNGNKKNINDEKILKFMKEKLKKKHIVAIIQDGELWTKQNGELKRILWTAEPVSIPNDSKFTDLTSNERFKNTMLTRIYTFQKSDKDKKTLYTKDNKIIIEDSLDYDNINLSISNGYSSYKNIKEFINGNVSSGSYGGKVVLNYLNDKKKLDDGSISEEDFKEKWDLSKNDYAEDINNMKTKINQYQNKINTINITLSPIEEKINNLEKNSRFPNDYYTYTSHSSWITEEERTEYLNSHPKDVQEMLKKYDKLSEKKKVLKDELDELETKIYDTPNEFGFNRFSTTEDGKKWISRLLKDSEIAIDRVGKNIEFRGKGRIDGTIDLGEGDNYLTIAEQFSGKFGTNITLGANSKLKNIHVVQVGGQIGGVEQGQAGLSGKSSLSIEIDPNKVNDKGYLYQHALKDTWTKDNKIIFRSTDNLSLNNINNFSIEFKASSIGKDMIVDMGRPLDYKAPALKTQGSIYHNDSIDYKIKLYSDSIAHQLTELNEKSDDGNSLLKVNLKEHIKRLNNDENKVYKSMKDSGNIGYLSSTLSTANKKTVFSAEEDKIEENKTFRFISSLKNKKDPDLFLKELSHFNMDDKLYNQLKDDIIKLENNKKVITALEQSKNLKKYKKLDFSKPKEKVIAGITEFSKLPDISSMGWEDKSSLKKQIKEKYGNDENKIKEKAIELSNYYNKNLKNFYKELDSLKPNISDHDIYEAVSIRNSLESLENPYISSYSPEGSLLDIIESYQTIAKNISSLKEKSEHDLDKELLKILDSKAVRGELPEYNNLIANLYYTQRQEESLREFKNLISQIYDKNIYSKINKISKNGIDIFNPLPFDTRYNFNTKKTIATGGSLSGRFSQDKFKGTMYTGYGIYETPIKENLNLGFIIGGGASSHNEIVNDTLRNVSTTSKIKGTRAYLGSYSRYNLAENTHWINGLGIQYASYDVDRDFKNHYQNEMYKGKVKTLSENIYTGIAYKHKISDTLDAHIKGFLSYTIIGQEKATEENKPLSLEINNQNFDYLDGQIGIELSKTIYTNKLNSSLSGGIYSIYGISGYDNDNLKGNFKGSTSNFDIKGENYNKNSIKLKLNYNVYSDSGFDYGLEGSYTKNSDENNISVAIKAGFSF